MNETVFESWVVNSSEKKLVATFIFGAIVVSFLFSFYIIFLITRSTNIILLVVPIILFLLTISSLPEYLKSLSSNQLNAQISLTETGISVKESGGEVKLTWEQIASYDMKYFNSTSPLGSLFPKPTSFIFKMRDDSSYRVDSFGETVDVVRAYLKEKNIPFGFVQK